MVHALITGGAGFIGSHLAERLLNAGYTVTIIDNLSTGRIENLKAIEGHPQFHVAIEDIRNINVMDRLVSECDVIFHLAAAVGVQRIISEPIETIETNIGGTEVVLKAARRYRKKVMIASTSEVYGKGVRFPFHEDDDSVLGPTTRSRWSCRAMRSFSSRVMEAPGLCSPSRRVVSKMIKRSFMVVLLVARCPSHSGARGKAGAHEWYSRPLRVRRVLPEVGV